MLLVILNDRILVVYMHINLFGIPRNKKKDKKHTPLVKNHAIYSAISSLTPYSPPSLKHLSPYPQVEKEKAVCWWFWLQCDMNI